MVVVPQVDDRGVLDDQAVFGLSTSATPSDYDTWWSSRHTHTALYELESRVCILRVYRLQHYT
jgi:hypothetical protein